MLDLFSAYPELRERIDGLCRGASWCVAAASALVHDGDAVYFEVERPRHWLRRQDGTLVGGIAGLGGGIEPGETVLACLHREMQEELGVRVEIESARETELVYEQTVADPVALGGQGHPVPALCTISENLHLHDRHRDWEILVIVTFLARLLKRPAPNDLFGLLAIPGEALASVLSAPEIALSRLRTIRGVRVVTQEPLPQDMLLRPVWTARSLQLLLQAGRLSGLGIAEGVDP